MGGSDVCLILGDNLFYGQDLTNKLNTAKLRVEELGLATIYLSVKNPEDFGVVEFDQDNKLTGIEEKPPNPKSNYAITGLYFYPNRAVHYAKNLKKSIRGELEITDIIRAFLDAGKLHCSNLGEDLPGSIRAHIQAFLKHHNLFMQSKVGKVKK